MAKSLMEILASLPEEERLAALSGIDPEQLVWDWPSWARPEQMPPEQMPPQGPPPGQPMPQGLPPEAMAEGMPPTGGMAMPSNIPPEILAQLLANGAPLPNTQM